MVARLMPHVAPDVHADNVAVASFDYGALDEAAAAVRLRLNATAVGIENTDAGVTVDYVKEGRLCRVSAQHAVLACYHSIIPHLCPTLDGAQKEALRYQVKTPMLLTNVLIRNSSALDKLGVDENEVTPEASFTNDLGADSLDTVELIMEFEKEFNVAIPDEQAETIGTVGQAVSYLEKNVK